MDVVRTIGLFALTALMEILGCYLPFLWLQKGRSVYLLIPAALALSAFVWLLTLHPVASGRVYAAYGGIYVSVAFLWLIVVDKVKLAATDVVGVLLMIAGALVVISGYQRG